MPVRKRSLGLSLIEICVTVSLLVILAGLSLWVLQPGKEKATTRGLATALVEEFAAARQLAIAGGRPVALAMPTDGGGRPRSSSLFRLEGWNKPTVTWSRGFSGDYPKTVFLAARWPGPSFTGDLGSSILSKFAAFNLDNWLPDQFEDDYVFCFLPDGSLVTNGLPSLDGNYTVVVADLPAVSGSPPGSVAVTSASGAVTLLLSPSGAVRTVTGLPGGPTVGGPGGSAESSAPQARTDHAGGGATVQISEILVRPNPALAPPGQGICTPGQFVTLEVYAYDPEGRALFAKWTQVSQDTPSVLGQFTYPDSTGQNPLLSGEVDKMEFTYDIPAGLNWIGAPPPPGVGVFRARWSWTVPITSQPGHRYTVQADVKDVKGEVEILNPPTIAFQTPPQGRLVVEQRDPLTGLWRLVIMNPDGSCARPLSAPGDEEIMPTVDRSASKLACLAGPDGQRKVRIRNLDGGGEIDLDGPGDFTSISLSPDGGWVSYRNDSTNTLITKRVDNSAVFTKPQSFVGGSGPDTKKARAGWSQNSRFLIYEFERTLRTVDLHNPGYPDRLLLSEVLNNTDPLQPAITEALYAPTSYQVGGQERILLSLGNFDPVLISFRVDQSNYLGTTVPGGTLSDYDAAASGDKLKPDLDGGGGSAGSSDLDDDFPNVSSDSRYLILTRSNLTSGGVEDTEGQTLLLVPVNGENFVGPPQMTIGGDVRRAVWIPAPQ